MRPGVKGARASSVLTLLLVTLALLGGCGPVRSGSEAQESGGPIRTDASTDERNDAEGTRASEDRSGDGVPERAPVAVGAYVAGFPGDDAAKTLDAFARKVGRGPAFVTWYQDWVGPSGFIAEHFAPLRERSITPMLSWSPSNYSKYGTSVDQPEYRLSRIAAGDWDPYIRQTARDMRAYGEPIYLRFAHEMNGDWYPWGVGANGNTAAHYVAAWRHVHAVFEREGATNVRWVWSPNVAVAGSAPFGGVYPGDAYVDWAALDGYNWGTADRGGWRGFSEVFGPSYERVARITGKPVMIAETSSAEDPTKERDPTRKASWITDTFYSALPTRFPRVKAVLWFNIDLEREWQVGSSAESLSAYREAVNEPRYRGVLP